MTRSPRLLTLIAFLTAPSAFAVFPDRPTSDFKSVGMIGSDKDGRFKLAGCGVAISPNWVVGVSHVGGQFFFQDGHRYRIVQKIAYKSEDGGEPADIAVYRLGNPVANYATICISPFEGTGFSLKGKVVFLVGYGRTAV